MQIIQAQELSRTSDNIITWDIPNFTQIRNVPYGIPPSVFSELWDDVFNKSISIPCFDEDRNILHGFYSDYICIEYIDPQIREKDKMNNQNHYELVNLFQSKKQDEQGRQFSKNVWEFEYNGKYHLVVSPRNTPLPQNDTISERWIFMSIIVDMEKYNSTKTWKELLVQQTSAAVDGVIQSKE